MTQPALAAGKARRRRWPAGPRGAPCPAYARWLLSPAATLVPGGSVVGGAGVLPLVRGLSSIRAAGAMRIHHCGLG